MIDIPIFVCILATSQGAEYKVFCTSILCILSGTFVFPHILLCICEVKTLPTVYFHGVLQALTKSLCVST